MGFHISINSLTGAKPQGYADPSKSGKKAMIEVVPSAKTMALKKAVLQKPMNGTNGNYTFSKKPSNGIGVGP